MCINLNNISNVPQIYTKKKLVKIVIFGPTKIESYGTLVVKGEAIWGRNY